jgi:hypothetical protein
VRYSDIRTKGLTRETAVAGTVFSNQLKNLLPGSIPQATTSAILQSVTVINALPPGIKNIVIEAYVKSMRPVFIMAVPAGALGLLSALYVGPSA